MTFVPHPSSFCLRRISRPDPPIKKNELAVYRRDRPNLRRPNLVLQSGEKVLVAFRTRNYLCHSSNLLSYQIPSV